MIAGLGTKTAFQRVKRLEQRLAPPQQWRAPLDPVEMAAKAGIILDDWQSSMVRSGEPRVLLNCSRQVGKSTSAGVLAVHTCLAEENALALLLAPSLRQAGELFRSCLGVYRDLGRPVLPRQESALRLELANGSRIVSLPGKEATIRGFAGVRLLVIDEASRVPDSLYMALRPMIAVSGGKLVLLSTPYAERGFFYEAWKCRENWDYYEVPAEKCPRISKAFLEEERRTMGQYFYEQEYECKFNASAGASFRSQDIDAIIKKEVELWQL